MATTEFQIGKREVVGIVEESSYGAGGDMANNGEVLGFNARVQPGEWSRGWSEILTAGEDSRKVAGYVTGRKDFPHNLVFNPSKWKFLKYFFDVSDSGSDPYTHTFSLANTINSYELEWVKQHSTDPLQIRLGGGYGKSLTISFSKQTGEGEGSIEVNMNCNAQDKLSFGSATSFTELNDSDIWRYHDVKLTIGGTEITELNSGSITIEQSIDENDFTYCNATLDRKKGQPIPKTFRVTGTFNINTKDTTFFDYWEADQVISGTNKIEFIKNAVSNYLNMEFENFRIRRAIKGTEFEGVNNVDVVWFAEGFSTLEAVDDEATY